ncbi:DUF6346 domain-containing protein [Bounagaea algeriensis]
MASIFLVLALISFSLIAVSMVASGSRIAHSEDEVTKSGTAVATDCWADGPLILNLWERCRLDVTWNDGTSSTETSIYGDFSSDDVGQSQPVNHVSKLQSQHGGRFVYTTKDEAHPWSWLGTALVFPFGGFGLLCLIAVIFILKPPKPNKKKRKGKPGKAQAKQQQ